MIYATRNAALIATLHPTVQAMANQWLGKLQTAKREVLITNAYRTPQQQQALWDQGRITPGKIVTDARGVPVPQSMHCFKVAFDFCPVDAHGNCIWNQPRLFWLYAQVAHLCGFEWGGNWLTILGFSFPDKDHLQYTGGLSLADFQSGKTLPPPL